MEPVKVGFSIAIGLVIIVLIMTMIKTKQNRAPYGWLMFHFIVFFVAGYFFYQAMNSPLNSHLPQSVQYDQIKIFLWMSFIAWIFSLLILMIAIGQFIERHKK